MTNPLRHILMFSRTSSELWLNGTEDRVLSVKCVTLMKDDDIHGSYVFFISWSTWTVLESTPNNVSKYRVGTGYYSL